MNTDRRFVRSRSGIPIVCIAAMLVAANLLYGQSPYCPGALQVDIHGSREGFSLRRWGATGAARTVITYSFVGASYLETNANEGAGGIDVQPILTAAGAGAGGFPANTKQLVEKAFRSWESAADVRFVEVTEPAAVGDIRVGAHTWAKISSQFTVLGHGFTAPVAGESGAGAFGDLHFNSDRTWNNPKEFFLVAVHEIGHALGLEHIIDLGDQDNLVMYAFAGANSGPLSHTDKAYVQSVYGPPTPSVVDGSASDGSLQWSYVYDPFASFEPVNFNPATSSFPAFDPASIDPADPANPPAARYTAQIVRCGQIDPAHPNLSACSGPDARDIDVVITATTMQAFQGFAVEHARHSVQSHYDGAEPAESRQFVDADGAWRIGNDKLPQMDQAYTRVFLERPVEGEDAISLMASPRLAATHLSEWRFQRSYALSADHILTYKVTDVNGDLVPDLSFTEFGVDTATGSIVVEYDDLPTVALPASVHFENNGFVADLSALSGQEFTMSYVYTIPEYAFTDELVYLDDIELANILVLNESFASFAAGLSPTTQSLLITGLASGFYDFRVRGLFAGGASTAYSRSVRKTTPGVYAAAAEHRRRGFRGSQAIRIRVGFTTPVEVNTAGGTPVLELATAAGVRQASYVGGTADTLVFQYIVQGGDAALHLDYTGVDALQLQGATIQANGVNVDLSLPPPGSDQSLNGSAVFIDTVAPDVGFGALLTNDTTPPISGTVNASQTELSAFTVTINGQVYSLQNSMVSIANGAPSMWTIANNVIQALPGEGTFDVAVQATDLAGNVGIDSTLNELTIDLTPPTVTVTDKITNDATPGISGTVNTPVSGLSTFTVMIAGQTIALGSGAINFSGTNPVTWTVADNTIQPALAEGAVDVLVTAVDKAGNSGVDTTANELVIDLTAPVTMVTGLATQDRTPALSGTLDTAPENLSSFSVTVVSNTYTLANGDVTIGAGTPLTWTLADNRIAPELAEGVYSVLARAVDRAGNIGTDATSSELRVDVTAPMATVNPSLTRDATPTLTGTVDTASNQLFEFEVTVNGSAYSLSTGKIAITTGTPRRWSVSGDGVQPALADGTYDVAVTATDLAGNIGHDASTGELTVDTSAEVVRLTFTPNHESIGAATVTFGVSNQGRDSNTDSLDIMDQAATMYLVNHEAPGLVVQKLVRDFRQKPLNAEDERRVSWELVIEETVPGLEGRLSWEFETVARRVYLQRLDEAGVPTGFAADITETAYIDAVADGSIEIIYGPRFQASPPVVQPGWNLIGFPLVTTDSSRTLAAIYGGVLDGPAYVWNGERFTVADLSKPLNPERGYWIRNRDSVPFQPANSVIGMRSDGRIQLHAGWNLVGPTGAAINVDTLFVQGLLAVWGWNAETQRVQPIGDGGQMVELQAYWLFAPAPMTVDLLE